ncbi:MAG TPA: DISARM system SNF2-like helicase DrmD [Planctomycetota bacterium]|nr:DISARM system SNF2-like helicase DrmD [Planctomycetota bacterium]
MSQLSDPPQPGQIVRVRMRRWLVEGVARRRADDDCTLVRLACLDDDAQGDQLTIFWEKELDPEIQREEGWRHLGDKGFDHPRLFGAFLHTMRWNCVTATDPTLFQSPFRAGIKIEPYQLEPLRKALQLPRVNLFIADDVGLGKTIEAGLIARELLLRRRVDYLVVVCPPSVLLQWRDELDSRFGLTTAILDRDYITRIRSERGYGTNPWTTHSRFLVSERLLIDEAYAADLRNHLGELRARSLLIFDEAHHAAPSSGAKYAIDSQITRAMRDLARRFEHRLFLSATPHNGHSNSFSALLEILDPQRFIRGVPVTEGNLRAVLVRRLKEDLRQLQGGFPRRETPEITISGLPADAPELQLSTLLDQYRELREQRLQNATKSLQRASGLLLTGLQQRLLSSIEAFARTLRVHQQTAERQWQEFAADLPPATAPQPLLFAASPDPEDDRATQDEAATAAEEDAEIAAVTKATTFTGATPTVRAAIEQERALLARMQDIAETHRHRTDKKVERLVAWIRTNLLQGRRWNDQRLLLFTEYDDTKRYLVEQLNTALHDTDDAEARIRVYHGPTPVAEREKLKRAFNADPKKHPLRILVATDAAREGLNLQNHCSTLFHFDLPWNPGRLEQRNGRIDRKLQKADVVHCHYFVYAQRSEDRVLQALVRKTATIRRELGSLSQVLDDRIEARLRAGIRHKDVDAQVRAIEQEDLEATEKATVERELEAARNRQDKLRSEIDRLRTDLAKSRDWIRFDEDSFRDALSCSLELQRAPGLSPLQGGAFTFPELDKLAAADPTWRDTLDTLRTPRERDQEPWEWRQTATVRPVVFADQGELDDQKVHLHLEHRIAQRLLGYFRAQGFVQFDLSRACLAQTKDPIPRVLLLGRLALYGPHAARLHEEMLVVAARWSDLRDRQRRPLEPFADQALDQAMAMLEDALAAGPGRPLDRVIQGKLAAAVPQDIQELRPHLERIGKAREQHARTRLQERGRIEGQAMADILQEQKQHIAATDRQEDRALLRLKKEEFGVFPQWIEQAKKSEALSAELRQLQSNRRHWQERLAAIDAERKTEPARIRALYEVHAARIEPVGLVYLYPQNG